MPLGRTTTPVERRSTDILFVDVMIYIYIWCCSDVCAAWGGGIEVIPRGILLYYGEDLKDVHWRGNLNMLSSFVSYFLCIYFWLFSCEWVSGVGDLWYLESWGCKTIHCFCHCRYFSGGYRTFIFENFETRKLKPSTVIGIILESRHRYYFGVLVYNWSRMHLSLTVFPWRTRDWIDCL